MADAPETDDELDERLLRLQSRLARNSEVQLAAERFLQVVIATGEKLAPKACPAIVHRHAALTALEWRLVLYFRSVASCAPEAA